MKYITTEGKITDDELILIFKIPKFYLDDEELLNKFLLFKTLFKFDGERVMFLAPMIFDNKIIYPDK